MSILSIGMVSAACATTRTRAAAAGLTLVELTVAVALVSVLCLASTALKLTDRGLSAQALHGTPIELAAQNVLLSLEHELANAFGERPVAIAPLGLGAGVKTLQVDCSLGFPPTGTVVIDRGRPNEERLEYAALGGSKVILSELTRGVQCTANVAHGARAEVRWAGLGEPLAQQEPPPPPGSYDGVARRSGGRVYFRGDGTGFSYRIPVDRSEDPTRGAEVRGKGATPTGWTAVYFRPRLTFDESVHEIDVNRDGDTRDVFDVGQLRRVAWDTSDPAASPFDVGIGPTAVLQERCNHGGDLDGDGFDDPLFLWDPSTNELHVRMHLISTARDGEPIVRRIESVLLLRDEPEP